MFLILWMGEPVVTLWGVLFYATSSELDSLVLTLAILCLIKEIVLVPIKKESFRNAQRRLASQPKPKELEERCVDDPDELSRIKAKMLIDEGEIVFHPLLLAFSVVLAHVLVFGAVFAVFWTPDSFAEYTVIDDLYSAAHGGALLQINGANLFEQLISQLNKSPLSWGTFVAAELFVLVFGNVASERAVKLQPKVFQLSVVVLLFLPAGLWLTRMVSFCIAWLFASLFEQWKSQQEIIDPSY